MSGALDDRERTTLLRLARSSIEDRLLDGSAVETLLGRTELTPRLRDDGASFVTLRTRSSGQGEPPRLRGCIGTIDAREALFRDVIGNAAKSALADPRFPALSREELDTVALSISVLTPLRPVDDPAEIVLGRDGVQLEQSGHRAVFLPQVAVEQRWDRDALLEHLAVKAGLQAGGWRGGRLSTFRTESFGES
jgi:AmmeMemoRadiSam system protein A